MDYTSCFFPLPRKAFSGDHTAADASCSAFCRRCGATHSLAEGPARPYALELISRLVSVGSIDLFFSGESRNPKLSTDYLYGEALGQMFGVMLCKHRDGTRGLLHAFSCQYNGMLDVTGWVPPLFDPKETLALSCGIEKEIKSLSREMEQHQEGSSVRIRLMEKRRFLSQSLMKDLHSRYRLNNFRGEICSLPEVFNGKGIPTGSGDCCAPKLLNYAARHGLKPLGLSEFYWGRENRSGSRQQGMFYPPCKEKCDPILGFMLCGLDLH